MTVGDLKKALSRYPDTDIIYASWWDQELLLEMVSDALECEVLEVGIDRLEEISNELEARGAAPDLYEDVSDIVWDLYRSKQTVPTAYESDTPLGQQYGDGAEVDQ